MLLEENSAASVSYAALEARLALEKVCYDRLRQHHDYISHEQLKGWRPKEVIDQLICEVDADIAGTLTLSMSSEPCRPGMCPENYQYTDLGRQAGFKASYIGALWNALSNIALHVRLPENRDDEIADYGSQIDVQAKVEEVVRELKRLSQGNMLLAGAWSEVSFVCSCGELNRRSAETMVAGRITYCANARCDSCFLISIENDEICFEEHLFKASCEQCQSENSLKWRPVSRMKRDQIGTFRCISCNHLNHIQWRVVQVKPSL